MSMVVKSFYLINKEESKLSQKSLRSSFSMRERVSAGKNYIILWWGRRHDISNEFFSTNCDWEAESLGLRYKEFLNLTKSYYHSQATPLIEMNCFLSYSLNSLS